LVGELGRQGVSLSRRTMWSSRPCSWRMGQVSVLDALGGRAFGVGGRETGQRSDQAIGVPGLEIVRGSGELRRSVMP